MKKELPLSQLHSMPETQSIMQVRPSKRVAHACLYTPNRRYYAVSYDRDSDEVYGFESSFIFNQLENTISSEQGWIKYTSRFFTEERPGTHELPAFCNHNAWKPTQIKDICEVQLAKKVCG